MTDRSTDSLREDLTRALSRIPENGVVFTRPEVDRIATALGGYSALLAVLEDGRQVPSG